MKRRAMEIQNVDKKCGDDVPVLSKRPRKFELVNPSNESKADEGDLVELAKDIQKAYDYVSVSSVSKLRTIQKQMKFLREQAKQIIVEAGFSTRLHSFPCNFHKRVGFIYHVYKRSVRDYYISMLSPEEWGESMPHEHTGSYYLDFDMSWKPVDEKGEYAVKEIVAFSEIAKN